MSNSPSSHEGGCHCGSVRYQLAGEPAMTVNCHCLNCQKSSGSGHVFHLGFAADQLSVTGDTKSFHYTGDSGSKVALHFCPQCGTTLFGESESMPGFKTLRAATLDDSSSFAPQLTVYEKRCQSWDAVDANIPAFPAMPPMER